MVQLNRSGYPGGHTRVARWFLRDVMPTLTLSEVRVYLTIVRLERVQPSGREVAFVSNEKLCEWSGLSLRQARRAVDRVLELGLVVQVGEPRRGHASEYIVVRKRPAGLPRLSEKGVTHDPSNGPRKGVTHDPLNVRDTPRKGVTHDPPLRTTAHEPAAEPEGVVDGEAQGWFVEREAPPPPAHPEHEKLTSTARRPRAGGVTEQGTFPLATPSAARSGAPLPALPPQLVARHQGAYPAPTTKAMIR